MTDTTSTLTIATGATSTQVVGTVVDGSGVAYPQHQDRVNGAPVSTDNPKPVSAVQSGAWVVTLSGSAAVTGTFWQATQPVSLAALPALPAGPNAIGSVSVSNLPSTQAVSGTFWQSTQPVSIATMPSTPVTGTFWQATQPVSLSALPALVAGSAAIGTVGVTALPALPAGPNAIGSVSVSNFPGTQPVSLATAPTTPVTGTFWQATQPVSLTALPALTAGTAAIGTVSAGGFTATVQVTPTVQAAAYAAGATIGGLLTFANAARTAGSGLVQTATVTFASGVIPSLDLILFNASPAGGTITDKVALAVASTDLAKVEGVVHIADPILLGASSPSVVQGVSAALPFKVASGTTLYGVLVTRSAVTLGSTSDATVTINVLQD